MKIGIYCKNLQRGGNDFIYDLFYKFKKSNIELVVYQPFYEFMKNEFDYIIKTNQFFNNHTDIPVDMDLLFSIGGDGTFLECVSFVRNVGIPIVGINSGRMGFLANIAKEEITIAIEAILNNNFEIEERTLLELVTSNNMFSDFNYALNEFTVHKNYSSSMITIHTFVNGDFLNTYWADGLIIATPTGSTAYSLSAGGPIVMPTSDTFVITPIAPHNLTVRPIIIPNFNEVLLKVEGRSSSFLAALDYRYEEFDNSIELHVKKADFKIKMIKLKSTNFFTTLRNKLMWGIDKRN